MANTYTQIDIHLVFAVKGRQSLISTAWKENLYKYITGVIQNHKHKMLQINGMPDHIHIFIGYNPAHPLPNLVEEIKTSSNKYINEKHLTPFKFAWQEGYGAFSYSKSQREIVIKYISNQEKHHQKKTFKVEYLEILQKFEVDYREEYLFDFLDLTLDE
jgi:REP element-mobilizing transposase RayT